MTNVNASVPQRGKSASPLGSCSMLACDSNNGIQATYVQCNFNANFVKTLANQTAAWHENWIWCVINKRPCGRTASGFSQDSSFVTTKLISHTVTALCDKWSAGVKSRLSAAALSKDKTSSSDRHDWKAKLTTNSINEETQDNYIFSHLIEAHLIVCHDTSLA